LRGEVNSCKFSIRNHVDKLRQALILGEIPQSIANVFNNSSKRGVFAHTAGDSTYGGEAFFSDSEDFASDSHPKRFKRKSIFHYKDISAKQIEDLERMFSAIDEDLKQDLLAEPMDVRRIKAIANR